MYNENVAVADLDGDGYREIIGAHRHALYHRPRPTTATSSPASPIYGAGKVWSQVGVHVDHAVDLRGYANCGSEHRPNFADSAPAIGDMDGDGTPEIVVVGNVYNCARRPLREPLPAAVGSSKRTARAGRRRLRLDRHPDARAPGSGPQLARTTT